MPEVLAVKSETPLVILGIMLEQVVQMESGVKAALAVAIPPIVPEQ